MKRLFLSLALMFALTNVTMAQDMSNMLSGQPPFEPYLSTRVGVNFSTLVDDYFESDFQTGFNAAFLCNTPLMQSAPLYLQSGIGVVMKGGRNSNVLMGNERSVLKTYAIQIPLTLTYDMQVGKESALVPEVGVFYSFAFCGSLEGGGDFYRPYDKQTIGFADSNDTIESKLLHRSDFGIRAGLSYRYSKYLLGFAYDAGVINSFAKDLRDIGSNIKTGSWSVNLSYRFM